MGNVVQLPTLTNYQARFNEAATRLQQTDIVSMICQPSLKQEVWQDFSRNIVPLLSSFKKPASQSILSVMNAPLLRGFQTAQDNFNEGLPHDIIRDQWMAAVNAATSSAAAQAAKEARVAARPPSVPPLKPR